MSDKKQLCKAVISLIYKGSQVATRNKLDFYGVYDADKIVARLGVDE